MTALTPHHIAGAATESSNLRRLVAAGGLALALHAGAAAILLVEGGKADSDESFGALALEVGIESAAPSFDSSDAPADSDAAAAVAAAAPHEAPAVRPEPISATTTETSEPEQQVAMPPRRERVEQAEKDVPVEASTALTPSVSATAPSRTAEQESLRSVAAAIGSSAKTQRAQAAWRRQLVAHLERQKRYPLAGVERPADIIVRFTINRQGSLTAVEIAKGSGDKQFDQAALDMVRRADPLPKPPPGVADHNLSFRVPISFRSGG